MVKAYTVLEEQQFSDGSRKVTATARPNLPLAESTYYDILSKAAADGSPYHAAYLIQSNKGIIMSKYYDRTDESNG